jgi:hypothetical protein
MNKGDFQILIMNIRRLLKREKSQNNDELYKSSLNLAIPIFKFTTTSIVVHRRAVLHHYVGLNYKLMPGVKQENVNCQYVREWAI